MYQQALLSWGNLQYEESQMVAVAGGDWHAVLDEATAHFREAGCNEADIRGACALPATGEENRWVLLWKKLKQLTYLK